MRLSILNEKRKNSFYIQRLFEKLKKHEIEILEKFILENESLGKNDFIYKLNRFFLDKEKPKNWTIITEILLVSA